MSSATTVDFPVAEVFGKAWGRLLENIGAFLPAMLVTAGVTFAGLALAWVASTILQMLLGSFLAGLLDGLITSIVIAALTGPLHLGLFAMARRVSEGQSVVWSDVFPSAESVKPAVLASMLYSVMVFLGTMLCVLPGIIFSFLYCLTWVRLLEGERGTWQALESGRRMVMDNLVSWLILYLLLFFINGLGMIPCFLGLFVTVPFSALVLTDAHARQLNRA